MNIEMLMPFCSKDESRPMLSAPFTIGKFTYATDGRVCVRVPDFPDPPPDIQVTQGIAKLGWDTAPRAVAVELPKKIPCERTTECTSCDGTGTCKCECGDMHPCEDCGGDGKMIQNDQGVEVGKMFLGESYLRKLAALPGLKLYDNGGVLDVVYFTFDGGEGLLMPMRKA